MRVSRSMMTWRVGKITLKATRGTKNTLLLVRMKKPFDWIANNHDHYGHRSHHHDPSHHKGTTWKDHGLEEVCWNYLRDGPTIQVEENVAVLGLRPGTQQDAVAVGKPTMAVVVTGFEADQAIGCGP